jgi:hypothetical protein
MDCVEVLASNPFPMGVKRKTRESEKLSLGPEVVTWVSSVRQFEAKLDRAASAVEKILVEEGASGVQVCIALA